MNFKKAFVICILTFILIISMSACGEKAADTSNQQSESLQTVDQLQTDQEATVEAALPSADTKVSVDNLIGSWTDIASPDRFVNITKADSQYQYEDNEGKYPAEFKDGILKVTVSDTDTADVYIDEKTGHLLSVYQENISEFSRK